MIKKVRVWDKNKKVMSNVGWIAIGFGSSCFNYPQGEEEAYVGTEDENLVIMQSIIIKGDDGKEIEIFEHDIIEYNSFDNSKQKSIVPFIEQDLFHWFNELQEMTNIKVIGNKYEK